MSFFAEHPSLAHQYLKNGTETTSTPPEDTKQASEETNAEISSNSTNGDIVVYDPLLKKVYIDKLENLKGEYTQVPVSGRGMNVDIFITAKPTETEEYLATVSLSGLGMKVRVERMAVNIKSICVLGEFGDITARNRLRDER